MKDILEFLLPDPDGFENRPGFAAKEFSELDHVPSEGSLVFAEEHDSGDAVMATVLDRPDYDLIKGEIKIFCVLFYAADADALTAEKGWKAAR